MARNKTETQKKSSLNWNAISTLITAVVTIGLLCANLTLAITTCNQLKTFKEDMSRRTDALVYPSYEIENDTLSVFLRNYGSGPAYIDSVGIYAKWFHDSLNYLETYPIDSLRNTLSSAKGVFLFLYEYYETDTFGPTIAQITSFLPPDSSVLLLRVPFAHYALGKLQKCGKVSYIYHSPFEEGKDKMQIERRVPFSDFVSTQSWESSNVTRMSDSLRN